MSAVAEEPRFIADCMLGRLAKWLRVLGCDVAYDSRIGDDQLIARSRREGRVILTRDTRLVMRRALRGGGAPAPILIRAGRPEEQLLEMVEHHGLEPRPDLMLTRCLPCNVRTEDAARDQVRDGVPLYVFQTQEKFSRCPRCGRIYWRATHVEGMLKLLARRVPPRSREGP
jgi:hypothetical protein